MTVNKQQPSAGVVPEITATFECESNGITGSTAAPIKRIERHDDGSFEVVLDYWPTSSPQPTEQQPLPCQECGGDGAGGEHEEDCLKAQPTPDVLALMEALEHISNMDSMSYHSLESAKIVARKALAAYRKGTES